MTHFLPDVQFSIHGPMVSATGEAEKVAFKLLTDRSGRRWLVGDTPEAAENVWVDGGPGSVGCGGRTVTFKLTDGSTVDLRGPWKTGAAALYENTGVDVRNTYLCRGVISLGRVYSKKYGQPDSYTQVLHYDEQPVMRDYSWLETRAKELANELGVMVYCSQVTRGGGYASFVEPKAVKP